MKSKKEMQKHLFADFPEKQSFANFPGKHLYWSTFLIKFQAWRQCQYFSVKFATFLRIPFFIEHFQWLLLGIKSRNNMSKKCTLK